MTELLAQPERLKSPLDDFSLSGWAQRAGCPGGRASRTSTLITSLCFPNLPETPPRPSPCLRVYPALPKGRRRGRMPFSGPRCEGFSRTPLWVSVQWRFALNTITRCTVNDPPAWPQISREGPDPKTSTQQGLILTTKKNSILPAWPQMSREGPDPKTRPAQTGGLFHI